MHSRYCHQFLLHDGMQSVYIVYEYRMLLISSKHHNVVAVARGESNELFIILQTRINRCLDNKN